MDKLIAPQLGIAPETLLGGEACDREILVGLAQKGVEVDVLLPKGKPYPKLIANLHITDVAISHAPAIFYNLIFLPYLFRLYNKQKFKIIRVHSPRFIGLGVLVFKLFHRDIKIIASYHNFWETNFFFFTKFINRQWDFIFCDSQFVADRIVKELSVPKNKVTFAHNGISNYFKPYAKDKQLSQRYNLEGKKLFLSIGFLIDRKNPLFLVEVFADIVKKNPTVVLGYLGEGPLKSKIIQRAKELGIEENIIFFKPVFGEDRVKYFNLADVIVHPAKEEGFSLAVIEAMACGKPIIINEGYSSKEQIDQGKTGFICHFDNKSEWIEKIKFLINNPKEIKRFGENAYKKASKEFTWDNAINTHKRMMEILQ